MHRCFCWRGSRCCTGAGTGFSSGDWLQFTVFTKCDDTTPVDLGSLSWCLLFNCNFFTCFRHDAVRCPRVLIGCQVGICRWFRSGGSCRLSSAHSWSRSGCCARLQPRLDLWARGGDATLFHAALICLGFLREELHRFHNLIGIQVWNCRFLDHETNDQITV